MRPSTPTIAKADYLVESVPLAMGMEQVRAHHYARGGSNTAIYRHGLFRRDNPLECLGFAQWLQPTLPAAKSVSDDRDPQAVLVLTRLVVDPLVPTNAASFLLGASIRMIREDARFHTLLTYADEARGHSGGIYRATNWEYLGTVKSKPRWLDDGGRQVAIKSTANRTYAQMIALGLERVHGSVLHKFRKRLTI